MEDFTKNLTAFGDHPLIAHKVTHLCDINTGSKEFCEIVDELTMLMGFEALKDLKTKDVRIQAPLADFDSPVLAEGRPATIEDVARNVDEICALGGEDVVGFGSDFDGIETWPEGLANPSDFPKLLDRLRDWGYSERQLEKIAGLNYWRFLKAAEAASVV